MKITKAVYDRLMVLNPQATLYVIGAKDENEPFTAVTELKSDGGCPLVIPAVESREISSVVVNMYREGYAYLRIAWAPSAIIEPKRTVVELDDYLKRKAHGLEGVFAYKHGVYTVEDYTAIPIEIVD
jgi:hypothetical protein